MTGQQDATASLVASGAKKGDLFPSVTETLEIKTKKRYDIKFQEMNICKQRMLGRESAEIEGNIRFRLRPVPGDEVVLSIGVIPQDVATSYIPTTSSQVSACGGWCHYTPHFSTTFEYVLQPGISAALPGLTALTVSGKPPHLYFFAKNKADTEIDIELQVIYDLRVCDYTYVSPIHRLTLTNGLTSVNSA